MASAVFASSINDEYTLCQEAYALPLARRNAVCQRRLRAGVDSHIIGTITADGAHNGVCMTEITHMSYLFISAID